MNAQDVIAVDTDRLEAEHDRADRALEVDLAAAMKRKLDRLAKAQALAWNALDRETQTAYLRTVDRLEANS